MGLTTQKLILRDRLWRNFKFQHGGHITDQGFKPLKRPKENVDVTDATTPIIEIAKATVSKRFQKNEPFRSRSLDAAYLPHRKFSSKLASISKLSEFCIISANDDRGTVRLLVGNPRLSLVTLVGHDLQSQETRGLEGLVSHCAWRLSLRGDNSQPNRRAQ